MARKRCYTSTALASQIMQRPTKDWVFAQG